jgi:hypothetical protein
VDTRTIIASGLSAGPAPTVSALFIDHTTFNSFIPDTGVERPQDSGVDVFISREQVVLYFETRSAAQSLVYELEGLLDIANISFTCDITRLNPLLTRMSTLEGIGVMADYCGTRSTTDFWGSGRTANHEYLPVCTSMRRITGASVLKSKVHSHVFKSPLGSDEQDELRLLQLGADVHRWQGWPRMWIFPGFVVYVTPGKRTARMALRLIIFDHRRSRGVSTTLFRTISLPSSVDVWNIRRVAFDAAWGIFVLSLENEPTLLHIVRLI